MKRILLALCALLTGCSIVETESMPEGKLLVSIELTEGAFSGRTKGKTGYFFYVEHSLSGPMLTGWVYKGGHGSDLFGGGSDSASVVKAISDIGFEPFDFAKEVKEVSARLQAEAEKKGMSYSGPVVLDGAEYEITIATEKGTFKMREWNPGYTIDRYAPYSARIAKLKLVIDTLAQYYGRTKFGV